MNINEQDRTKIIVSIGLVATIILSLLMAIKKGYQEKPDISKDPKVQELMKIGNPLERNLMLIFHDIEVRKDNVNTELKPEVNTKDIRIYVPKGKPIEEIITVIGKAVENTTYGIADTYQDFVNNQVVMTFESKRKEREIIVLSIRRSRYYAKKVSNIRLIVRGFDSLSQEVKLRYLAYSGIINYSILPWEMDGNSSVEILTRNSSPLILSLPIESDKIKSRATPYTIMLDDSPQEVELKLSTLLRRVPSAVGFVTVGGELVLSKKSITKTLFENIENRNLIFFDTRNGGTTIAESLADDLGLRYYKTIRNIEGKTESEIRNELKHFVRMALTKRELIVWADATEELVAALEELEDYFEEYGIEIAGLSK